MHPDVRAKLASSQPLIYNVQPVSTSVERNMLTGKPTVVAEALTAVGPSRRSDRGDLIVGAYTNTGHGWWNDDDGTTSTVRGEGHKLETAVVQDKIPRSMRVNTDDQAPTLTSSEGRQGLQLVPPILGYEVDKERGLPNSEGIRVKEVDNTPTITADGDPTERTDRGFRAVSAGMVRRLTPTECERLQGFPDGWTVVDPSLVKQEKQRSFKLD